MRSRSVALAAALGLAVGALAIGRLAVGRARFGEVEIDDLTVRRLRVVERHEGELPERS
jgi:hypothetical protein